MVRVAPLMVGADEYSGQNAYLARNGDPPVDGLLGGDVLRAQSAVIDCSVGRLYLKPQATGRPVDPDIDPVPLKVFTMPIQIPAEVARRVECVRMYVSDDRGRTWRHLKDYAPSDREAQFTAPHDGLYWFSGQLVYKDGGADPPDTARLVPLRKVYVGVVGDDPGAAPAMPRAKDD